MKLARLLFSSSLIATQKASIKLSREGVRYNFFLSSPFLLFDRAAGFPSPRPWVADADARRSRQGWPLLRPPPGLALMPIEHDGTLAVSGANTLATSQFRFPLSLQNRGKCFREAHQLGRFRDH